MDRGGRESKRWKGGILVLVGALLLLGAVLCYGKNAKEAQAASENAQAVMEQMLRQEHSEETVPSTEAASTPAEEQPAEPSEAVVQETESDQEVYAEAAEPEEMPVITVNGCDYIGYLEIPSLGLQLPVLSSWSYEQLNLAPCRYSGSVYQGNMIVMAHNYAQFFGSLKKLYVGDEVLFTDGKQEQFSYRVTELEELSPEDLDALEGGSWDLTLFTCTVGGKKRVTVRCSLEA